MKRHMRVRLVISYFALTLLVIGLFGGYLFSRTYEMLAEELRRENRYQMERMRAFVEENYLERFQSPLLNKALTTIRSGSSEEINFFLTQPRDNNYYRIFKLSEDLRTLSMTLEGMDNVTLLFNQSQFTVDRHYYYDSIDRSPNAFMLRRITEIEPYQWFLRESGYPEGEERLLSYVYTLPYRSTGANIKGYMIVDLSVQRMAQHLEAYTSHPDERFYVYLNNLELAFTNDSSPSAQAKLPPAEAGGTDNLYMTETGDGERMRTVYTPQDSALGWTYVSERPLHSYMLVTNKLKQQIGLAGVMVLALGLIASLAVSTPFHRRFAQLTHNLQQLSGRYRERQLLELLHGRLPEEEESLLPREGPYAVALFHCQENNAEALLRLLRSGKQEGTLLAALSVGGRELTALFPCGERGELTEDASAILGRAASYRTAVGISKAATDASMLPTAYLEAQEAVGYSFIYGEDAVIPYRDIEHKRHIAIEMLDDRDTEHMLRSGDPDRISGFFREMGSQIKSSNLTLEAVELIMNQVAMVTAKVMLDLGKEQFRMTPSDVVREYKGQTLDDTLRKLEAIASEVVGSRESAEDDLHAQLAATVKSYIDERLDQDMSLDDLASYTAYSKQFICKVFKEQYEWTIVDYMSAKRIELAQHLLVHTELPAAEIAARSGFRSAQYFSTKFKQVCGVTPAQYRKQPRFDLQSHLQQ